MGVKELSNTWLCHCATFLFFQHFDVISDLQLNIPTATWNLFVNCKLSRMVANFEKSFIKEEQKIYHLNLMKGFL